MFYPLETAIKEKLIPALIGHFCSDQFIKVLSLPPRLGGLGIVIPLEMTEDEYKNSQNLTKELVEQIIDQKFFLTFNEIEQRKK